MVAPDMTRLPPFRPSRMPHAQDPRRGEEIAARFGGLDPDRAALIRGAAGSSPHLAGLLEGEGGWAVAALDAPGGALEVLLHAVREAPPDRLGPVLRQAKRRLSLLVALMDLAGAWPLEAVTGALTQLADLAVDRTMRSFVEAETARGRLPPVDGAEAGGMVALAMGKMGACELNYSSDIDLVLLFDETRFEPGDLAAARAGFVRVARAMTALLQDRTADGYVFRVDLRLRPDAAVTPVCLPMGAAESYYESVGRTWERAAYIKARPCAGDRPAAERFLAVLRPFVWRRHLDFAAIQDAHDIRLRIRDHKGYHGPVVLDGHDLKLGRGGIREIEFFVQTRQLIAGGRDPSLRLRGTREALAALVAAGWVPQDAAGRLDAHYVRLREVEHRLQMIADQQTHRLPSTAEGWGRLCGLMGEEEDALRRDLQERLEEVHDLTEGFSPRHRPPPRRTTGAAR
ncbi:Glutamine synthetase adenylyltransferase [Rubellimicrobium thermophilum DSM 16684]|uniref:Glutamine synthetase adenylyltransferase n=1 Tax=Rubellimicrobium thermophilum DSM 16684 TaxID=1123069 RepID=S9QWZ9_9RHOB|nr:Glutamine synthetase adenylyltransferase [Rubellimicrobium thermophilum DSM 16684]